MKTFLGIMAAFPIVITTAGFIIFCLYTLVTWSISDPMVSLVAVWIAWMIGGMVYWLR